jgi:peptidoglycan-associated lipoprotein
MRYRRLAFTIIVASAWFVACGGDPPPPPPSPTGPTAAELERLRADSIARERAQQDSIRQAAAARDAAAAAESARVRAARATLEEMVFFDYDQSDITAAAERVLRQKVEILRNSPGVRIRIEGHADERGSTEYNLALGNRRADQVRQFLIDFGLDQSRFAILSFGEERPLLNQSNEAAWSRNRRTEFIITAGEDMIRPAGGSQEP